MANHRRAIDLPPGARIRHNGQVVWRLPISAAGKPWQSRSGARYSHGDVDAMLADGGRISGPSGTRKHDETQEEKTARIRREWGYLKHENKRLQAKLDEALAGLLPAGTRERLARYLYLDSLPASQREIGAELWDSRNGRVTHINRTEWLKMADAIIAVVTEKGA
ncbi:hypothetical protein ACVCAH_11510 [Micromonospora sp. LZ34]